MAVERRKIWYSLIQVYREFAKESSVHGIKYTIQAKTTIERLLWLIVVIISLVCSGQLANQFYERHKSANRRTTVVTNQFPSLKLAIPAVTLCQGHLVSAERLRPFLTMQKRLYLPRGLTIDDFEQGLRYLREIVYPSNQYSDELEKLQRILNANRMSLPQLLEQISPNCTDLLVTCMYEGRNESCDELFVPILTTYGICCSFNKAVQRRWQTAFTRYTPKVNRDLYSINFGSRYILSVLLKPYNTSDRIASITYGDGYKFLIHERYTRPGPNAVEFMAGEAYETVVGLYGTCLTSSPEVLSLSSSQRDCR
ncbi:sodium channel protein Nach-like isoform X2 [Nasonia vitripennis]|uniref:Sodium channel protein Nach n=1 Tax=Nasonia vitripennis TaxID=7425 RepID=A0A7M7IN34_NASVI|nr:sodium channel protein Nach-like isoform X2 [Nasonia vitripennis]